MFSSSILDDVNPQPVVVMAPTPAVSRTSWNADASHQVMPTPAAIVGIMPMKMVSRVAVKNSISTTTWTPVIDV